MPKSKRQDRHSGDSDEQPNASSRGSSCPYEILGVPRDATYQQIKVSYRKLALKHHPDRQTSESDKKVAHERFASIGHAYEILGDEGRRREYDEGLVRQQQQQARQQGGGGQSSRRGGFGHDPFFSSSMFHDPFFSSPFGGGSQRQRSSSARTTDFHFTDPFELFEQFFAEEMGDHRNQQQHEEQQQNSSSRGRRMDPFASDPFFSDPFSSSAFGGSGSMMGGSSLFGMHNQMMNSMMSQMHNSSRSMFDAFDTGQSQQQQIMMSSSSSTRGGGGDGGGSGHKSVSTSTRTTIVNGVRKTIHERTVVHPDGRVERHVTTDDGNDNVGRLSSSANNYPALGYDGEISRSRRSYR